MFSTVILLFLSKYNLFSFLYFHRNTETNLNAKNVRFKSFNKNVGEVLEMGL